MKNNQVVVITGGSRGIGAATARLFAKQGYRVAINYKSQVESANKLVQEISELGGFCVAFQADVSTEAGVVQLFTQVKETLGTVSVLVNNAGILKPQMRLSQMSAERINEILVNNITSYFLCAREAINVMSTRLGGVGGCIVNVSSGAARSGSPNEYIDYAASKGAIDTLTKGLSVEVASEGIRVNGVRPGLIYTDMHADGGEPNRIERFKGAIPLQRGGEACEVAEAIYWLSSEQASFSTGTYIDVTGGL